MYCVNGNTHYAIFNKIICYFKNIVYICINKQGQQQNLYTMKTYTYTLRPVTDRYDMVLYYEFVRKEDDAILRASDDYDFILAYAEGYTTAINKSLIVE